MEGINLPHDGKTQAFRLLLGANSDQTFIKSLDVACDAEVSLLKNCKDLTMQFEVKYLFPTLFSGANFYIYGLLEGPGNEENIEKTQIRKTRKRTTNQG